jgi:TetR/AcrR family transcriptional regulator, mexJK operon transcriptional repressor
MAEKILRSTNQDSVATGRASKRKRVYFRKDEEVLSAAEELFLKHGYGDTSMDAVALRAGVTKATVYSNFASKEKLFSAVVKRSHMRRMGAAYIELDDRADVRSTLLKFGVSFLGHIYSRDAVELVRTVIAESFRFPKLAAMMIEGPFADVREQLIAYFGRRIAAGDFREIDPETMAAHFVGTLKSDNQLLLFLNQKVDVSPKAIQRSAESAVDLFLDGASANRLGRGTPRR